MMGLLSSSNFSKCSLVIPVLKIDIRNEIFFLKKNEMQTEKI